MAIDTTEIAKMADALMEIANKHLGDQYENSRIRNDQYGQAYSNTLIAVIQTSANLCVDAPLKEAQAALTASQKASIDSEKGIKEAQSVKDIAIKEAQAALIAEQKNVEIEKKNLTVRQKTSYDDQLRVNESDHLSKITMGFAMSGTTLPSDLLTKTLDAAANITP